MIVFVVPAASSKSERVFSAAGNNVMLNKASLNPEKVEDGIIVRCAPLPVDGTVALRGRSHFSRNDDIMIFFERLDLINCDIARVFHFRLCFVAVKMKYLPSTQSFSIFGMGRVGYVKESSERVGYSLSGPFDVVVFKVPGVETSFPVNQEGRNFLSCCLLLTSLGTDGVSPLSTGTPGSDSGFAVVW